MMYVLDTNVIFVLRKGKADKADINVTKWSASIDASALFIPAITLSELELGVLSNERKDAVQGALTGTWLNQHVQTELADRTLPVGSTVALRCAALHFPTKRSDHHALIAATALIHGMTLVTRNESDFDGTGAQIINPWEYT